MKFEYPVLAWLFILPAALTALYYIRKIYAKEAYIKYSSAELFSGHAVSIGRLSKIRPHIIFILSIAGISMLIIASMNPYKENKIVSVNKYGVDMVLALDASESMAAEDFSPENRFTASKIILEKFIRKRETDRIGLILFGSDAYVQCPQTTEYESIISILQSLKLGMVDYRRTAIGAALAVSASRLLKSKAQSRLIILITDGVDTASDKLRPLAAAEAIKDLGFRVYTIGIGRNRRGSTDFTTLKKISDMTGGKFYKAVSSEQLDVRLTEIDRLEKSFVNTKQYRVTREHGIDFIWAGLMLLFTAVFTEKILWPRSP